MRLDQRPSGPTWYPGTLSLFTSARFASSSMYCIPRCSRCTRAPVEMESVLYLCLPMLPSLLKVNAECV